MTIFVRQSELNAMGVTTPWPDLGYYRKRSVAAQILRARGDSQTAFLLEINNPIAASSLVFVNDTAQR